jgi:hypothetical protein
LSAGRAQAGQQEHGAKDEAVDASNGAQPGGGESDTRIEQFRSEIEALKLKGGSGAGEQKLLVAGVVVTAIGIALAVLGAVQVGASGGSPADQRAYLAQGSLMGLALIVAGAALFVRYSLGRYLRFWLIRLTYEGRANTDRVVDAIERAAGIASTVSTTAAEPAAQTQPPAPPAH